MINFKLCEWNVYSYNFSFVIWSIFFPAENCSFKLYFSYDIVTKDYFSITDFLVYFLFSLYYTFAKMIEIRSLFGEMICTIAPLFIQW